MEAALATGSMQHAIEGLLLPTLEALGEVHGSDSASWAFAARWADGWLRRATPVVGASQSVLTILLGDATGHVLVTDSLAVRAFELCCALARGRVTTLPVSCISGLPELAGVLAPDVLVIAGEHAGDDEVARWADGACAAGPVPIAVFRRARPTRVGTRLLPRQPVAAQRELMALAAGR
jgi:hypothetical protein